MTSPIPTVSPERRPARAPEHTGLVRQAVGDLLRKPSVVLAVIFLFVLGALGFLAPLFDWFDPSAQNLSNALLGPSLEHPFGTDENGRDQLSRVIFGGRTALIASLQGISIAFLLGVPIGALAGYVGGWLDRVVGWVVDLFMSLPGLLVAFVVIAVLGTGLRNAMIGVGIVLATPYARLARAVVLAEKQALYVDAARVMGLRGNAILWRHVFPNVAPAIIVQTSVLIGAVILIEASLSFLGLGAPLSVPSWGRSLSQARFFVLEQPFYPWPPGLAIAFTVLAFNVIGDGLRDALGDLGSGRRTGSSPQARRAARPDRATIRPAASPPTPGAPEPDREDGGKPSVVVDDLRVSLPLGRTGRAPVIDGISLELREGETLGLVGESGSGKSMTAYAILGLLPEGAEVTGEIRVAGTDLTRASRRQREAVRGRDIAMIFQEPGRALNPSMRVGLQVIDPARRHLGVTRREGRARAVQLLREVGIPDPEGRVRQYPHEFSGGMAQRVVIARALASRPQVLLADEPTTALDVSVQAQVLDLLRNVRDEFQTSLLFITHDLGIAADICDRVAVMYAGKLVEVGTVEQVINAPRHPYTRMLLASSPDASSRVAGWGGIEGAMPVPGSMPSGCRFVARCPVAIPRCSDAEPPMDDLDGHGARCIRLHEPELDAWNGDAAGAGPEDERE